MWQKRVVAAIVVCLAWLWLWRHVRGSGLGIRAQDTLYLALEDCTAVVPPHPLADPARTFLRAQRVEVAPSGSCAFQVHPPETARRRSSTRRTHKWFVYDSPPEFTTLLLDDPNVDVVHTPMSVLDKLALGPEVPPRPPCLRLQHHAPQWCCMRRGRVRLALTSAGSLPQVSAGRHHRFVFPAPPRCCLMHPSL